MKLPEAILAAALLCAAIACAACGGGDASDTGVFADTQQHVDAVVDAAGPDAGTDSGPIEDTGANDAGIDAGPDTGGGDVVADTGSYPPPRDAVIPLDGQALFPVALDGKPDVFYLVVDTGAARTAMDKALLRNVKNGVGVVTIDFGGGIVLSDFEVLAVDLSDAMDHIGTKIDGLIGQDLFKTMFFGIDYRRAEVTASTAIPPVPPPPFGAGDAIDIQYDLVQELPIVGVQIGGKTAKLIADTGSGVTILTESFVDPAVLQGGLKGYTWYTSYGSDPGTIVRLPSVSLSGAEVRGEWAVVVPDNFHLKPVFDALGIKADGFLGYPVYRHFYVAIDGGGSRYTLYPYPDTAHIPAGEWDRVGVEIARDAGKVVVDMAFSPSDANDRGIAMGDEVVSIGGTSVAGLGLDDIRLMLRGAPGDTRLLAIMRGGSGQEITVKVDRLLPR